IEHRSVQALASEIPSWFDEVNTIGWSSNYIFDGSVKGIILLFCGRKMIILSDECKKDPALLRQCIESHDIELLDCTPTLLQHWIDGWGEFTPPNLMVGGEAISSKLWQQLVDYRQRGTKTFNVYGPTECTVNSTRALVSTEIAMIGRPLAYVQCYILSENGKNALVPFGSIGELYIGGDGLARGYLNRQQLSEQRFIANPFYDATHPNSSERLYRTGDLVRYLPDGNLEFIGRVDDQVKIRGFRIELGEVEAQLAVQEGVESALVMAKELAGSLQLIGYIKASNTLNEAGQVQLITEIKERLEKSLPDHMMPSVLMVVNAWPLTANGKVDKKALPQPDCASLQGKYVAPCSDAEHALVGIFSQLLGIEADKISTTANFFDLGGHSLLAVKLMAKISAHFEQTLSLAELFKTPNIVKLGERLTIEKEQSFSITVPLHDEGEAQTLFVVPGAGGNVLSLQPMAQALGGTYAVYALQAIGLDGTMTPLESVERTARENIAALKEVQPSGPYHLVGHSYGGVVAFEMAKQLLLNNESVASLKLIDAYTPLIFKQQFKQRYGGQNTQMEELYSVCVNFAQQFGVALELDIQHLQSLTDSELGQYVSSCFQSQGVDMTPTQFVTYYSVYKANLNCYLTYLPTKLPSTLNISLYRATHSFDGAHIPDDYGWNDLLMQPLTIVDVAADHFSILTQPHIQEVF
ncbi:alpha/beta fold hydrolase, partial [Pseudoalteromonas sp. MMG022]|uniref:non-ribosomal peptide synthetase family protein n=1 Tax=Pseudoalteromonas sp. MMG022 TaxID=2909978 RepID=UPI001F1E483C